LGVGTRSKPSAVSRWARGLAPHGSRLPFFDDLLAKVEMVCAKADLAIARMYVRELGGGGDLALFDHLEDEFRRTIGACCASGRAISHA